MCEADDAPKWCFEKWCYVPRGCTIDGEVDSFKSTIKDSVDLYWSYKVCGSVDYFDDDNFQYEFKGCEERTDTLDVYFVVDASG